MAKIKLDGQTEHEVPEAVKIHLDSLDAKVASLEAEKSTIQAKADSAQEALEAAKSELKAKEDGFQARVDSAVQARIALVSTATKHGLEVKEDSADSDIRNGLILKAFPAAKLDGKDEAYLAARYDAALELLEATVKEDGTNSQKQQVVGNPVNQETKVDGTDWAEYQASFRK